mmetsp:Transcript_117924/g.279883  ORF Transcript_117924/g.279883 Transcript_117924/m.279883 type:complete len:341 (-) Transcript_117924:761-1783(-)
MLLRQLVDDRHEHARWHGGGKVAVLTSSGLEAVQAGLVEVQAREPPVQRLRQLRQDLLQHVRLLLQELEHGFRLPRVADQVLGLLRDCQALLSVGQEVHDRQKLGELDELVPPDHAIAIGVEERREPPAFLLGHWQGMLLGLADALDHRQQLHWLQFPGAVRVQGVELLVAGIFELLPRKVLHQPVRQEGDDAPQPLLVYFDHMDEVLEGLVSQGSLLDHVLALLCFQPAGHRHKLDHLRELGHVDEAILVGIEHVRELPALLRGDALLLCAAQLHNDGHQVVRGQVPTLLLVQRLELLHTQINEGGIGDALTEGVGHQVEHQLQVVTGRLQGHEQGLHL